MKDTFLTKEEYSELLYQSTFALFANQARNLRIFLLKPALFKPKKLWTGKQLISNIMKLIVSLSNESYKEEKGLTMKAKAKVPEHYLGAAAKDEVNVLIIDNELLRGIIDKNQIGSGSDYGLAHSFN
jgi:DNA-directed RNA polymerase I subunit RPA1